MLDAQGPESVPQPDGGATSFVYMDQDWFTRFYSGNPTSSAELANLDTDGDGWTGWQEYMAGTDPNDPASVFEITGLRMAGGNNQLTWRGGTNGASGSYAVEFTTNFITGVWLPVAYPSRTQGLNTYTLQPSGGLQGYYRVRAGN